MERIRADIRNTVIELVSKLNEIKTTKEDWNYDVSYATIDTVVDGLSDIIHELSKDGDTTEEKEKIDKLYEKYNKLMWEINVKKADGNLAKLCNLNTTLDETFDQFFDQPSLRKKYNDWDYELNEIMFGKSIQELEDELDKQDLNFFIEFFEDYIEELEWELDSI